MQKFIGTFKAFLFLMGLVVSTPGYAFVEQVMSYGEKYRTSMGLFSSTGLFEETSEEPEMDASGVGVFGEVHLQRTPWAVRVDAYSTERKTGDAGLGVNSKFSELRSWGVGFADVYEGVGFLYGGLGVGVVWPEARMTVLGESKNIQGKGSALGGYMLGMRWLSKLGLFMDACSHTVYAPVYPNGHLSSVSLGMGYLF